MTSSSLVGTIIENKYSLDEQIGHGGMGAVFRGTQLMVDRTVAVKLLQSEFSSHDNFKARFEVEAKAIGRMNHPNCITLFDFGYSHHIEAFYTVVEYINGRSLSSLLQEPTSLTSIVSVIRQIAAALDHAHHHGILHRDLKPENIMLAQMTDGTEMVKVLDFGIAQILKGPGPDPQKSNANNHEPLEDDFEADRITRVGEVFGTPPYMSPEQARSTRNLSPACDLYSLGVIFYELVAGHLPFFSENPLDILLMHLNEPPPPIQRLESAPELNAIIMALLEKIPTRRPQSGKELLSMLDALSPEMLGESPSPANIQPRTPDIHNTPDSQILISTQPVLANTTTQQPDPLLPNRSWVETVEPHDAIPIPATFAPPPQALPRKKRTTTQPNTPTQPAPKPAAPKPAAPKPQPIPKRADAFETVMTFDDIDATNQPKQSTRWKLLAVIIVASALLGFGLLQFTSTPPIANAPQDASHQTAPTAIPTQTQINHAATQIERATTNASLASQQQAQTNADLKALPPKATKPEPPTFPEATRPATQKRQAAKSSKNRPKTSTKKNDKLTGDSSNPPSKGPRILEF